MKVLKPAACAIAVIAVILIFFACSYPPELRYENFLTDMDMITRFDICFEKVKGGDTSFYNREELRILKEDIASFKVDDDKAEEANNDLTLSADALLACMDYIKEGRTAQAEEALSLAEDYYEEAVRLIRLNRPEQENV